MLKKNQNGFTIIEVLMVLAIAGVIMLIVFLAVPALQRNSRNTQRKNDVSAAIASIQEYSSNNNGQMPTSVGAGIANAKLGFFAAADFTGSTAATAAQSSVTTTDGVVIQNYAQCPTTLPAANTAAVTLAGSGTKRSLVAVYRIEISGGYQAQCVDM